MNNHKTHKTGFGWLKMGKNSLFIIVSSNYVIIFNFNFKSTIEFLLYIIYIYICMYIYIYIYTCICMYIYIYVCIHNEVMITTMVLWQYAGFG